MGRQVRGLQVVFVIAAVGFVAGLAQPAHAIKVMAYNLLNYPGTTANERDPNYQLIIADVQPDIVMAGEVEDGNASTEFLNNVLNVVNPGLWSRHDVITGGDTLQILYYRNDRLEPTGTGSDRSTSIATTPRVTPRWKIRPIGYTATSNVFYIYGCHLKAANTADDISERAAAASNIRSDANGFSGGTRFLVCGDLNLYTAAEACYTTLTGSQSNNNGRCADPLNPSLVAQNWSQQSAYVLMHSQSPRATNPPSQPGGTLGGLDDRFDFLLPSTTLNGSSGISYISGSYVTYGQDGLHYNKSVNVLGSTGLPNQAVSQTLADALWDCSDHLPVIFELRYPARIDPLPSSIDFGTVIVGAVASNNVTVTNTAPTPGETLSYTYFPQGANFTAPSGSQSEPAGGGSNVDALGMVTATAGVKDRSPAYNISTNARENLSLSIAATGTVLNHAVPSTSAGSQVLSANLGFGAHPIGGFTDQPASVYDAGFNSLQATLNVYDYVISGPDAARFTLVNLPPVSAGASPAVFNVHFDDTAASACTSYTATLTFHTRDPVAIPGATNLADVAFNLTAAVGTNIPVRGDFNANATVDCGDIPGFIATLLDPGSATQLQLDTADMNVDCKVDGLDIQPFENALNCP